MLTRRTATVTISAPETSMASLVSAKFLYFPVPTMSRERYRVPAKVKKSSMLASADKMNDFQRVAFIEARRGVNFSRDDASVQLDNDTRRTNLEFVEETAKGQTVFDFTRFAIDLDLHVSVTSGRTAETPVVRNHWAPFDRLGANGTRYVYGFLIPFMLSSVEACRSFSQPVSTARNIFHLETIRTERPQRLSGAFS